MSIDEGAAAALVVVALTATVGDATSRLADTSEAAADAADAVDAAAAREEIFPVAHSAAVRRSSPVDAFGRQWEERGAWRGGGVEA